MASTGKRKHILIIVQNLPVPFDRRVWLEATSLQKAGYEVSVICPQKGKHTASYEQLENVHIYRYPLIYEAGQGALGYFVEFLYCWWATLFFSIRVWMRRRYQVIHACNPPDTYFLLGLLYRPLGVKFIFDHHDLSPEMYLAKGRSRKSLLFKGLLLLEHWTFRSAHQVIEVNQSHKQIALERGRVPEDKVTIVRSGPRSHWAEQREVQANLKNGKDFMVVYLGEMCEQDGVDYLLRAIRYYRDNYPQDTQFILIGGGPDQQRMQAYAAELDVQNSAHFTGRIPDEELWAYLSTADVCVDPDPWTEWSNMSTMNKIIEYMAFDRPIVAFDLMENRRSAEEAAVYVTPNDELKFAHAIRRLLDDPVKRDAMAAYGRERFVKQLVWENSEQALLEVYEVLLGNEPS